MPLFAAGFVSKLFQKAKTGITNLITNAKIGKQAAAQGFIPQAGTTKTVFDAPSGALALSMIPWRTVIAIVALLGLLWFVIKRLK